MVVVVMVDWVRGLVILDGLKPENDEEVVVVAAMMEVSCRDRRAYGKGMWCWSSK